MQSGKRYIHRILSGILIVIFLVTCIGGCSSFGAGKNTSDGTYSIEVSLLGGTGKASIESPTTLTIEGDTMTARIVWSSSHYDYMVVDDTRYEPLEGEDTSVFEIPVKALDEDLEVVADTTAMSVPHEIEYILHFDSGTMKAVDGNESSDSDSNSKDSSKNSKKNDSNNNISNETKSDDSTKSTSVWDAEAPKIDGLDFESKLELSYATQYQVFFYKHGYTLIEIKDSGRYLVVPEKYDTPKNLDEDIIVLEKPLNKIYLAATSAMALFDSADALDFIKFSGQKADGWYVENAKKAMEDGSILYAGKYSEPDYETLMDEGCNLAIESTMILHTPKVKEMLEALEIPVMIERSSYETEPLGRTEWIKLYGVLTDHESEANAFFEEQAKVMEDLVDVKNTKKTVAFFYLNSNGTVVVRKSEDYIPRMIEIAGGNYIFDDLENSESNSPSVELSMEEFYATAKDADYLIYNSSIDSPLNSMNELIEKSELFADFKAVKNGNVWCTGKYLYQATDSLGEMIRDIHLMLTDGDEGNMKFLYRIS